ncbi:MULTISPECIES: NUDIX hydrolase [unclassified Microbacterium]|uniref:NUDIX hydrolase n=1 Tax=unclassified Microbacterium TaxID=2609290 RepID=UPI00300FDB7D
MTIVPPEPGEPRRPLGPLDSGDAWVIAPTGERYWGRYGAAGLLAYDAARGVLLQHRVGWSHFGGTWALPGGALHEGESAIAGARREAQEEAGVPDGAVRARFASVFDLGYWSYTTVVADVSVPFSPVISDPESVALEWVPVDEVGERPLHPGFAAAWPALRELLTVRPVVVVDAANVVGSVPDGWWKDRAGAAGRLRDRLDAWRASGVPGAALGVAGSEWHGDDGGQGGAPEVSDTAHDDRTRIVWFPEIDLVVEGAARDVAERSEPAGGGDPFPRTEPLADAGVEAGRTGAVGVSVVRAAGHGDDAIVERVAERVASGALVTAVTSDRELRERVETEGASVLSAGRLRALLDA